MATLIADGWARRASASSVCFRARHLPLGEVISQILPIFNAEPCPSPIIVEYLKEFIVSRWEREPGEVDAVVHALCDSAKTDKHFTYTAVAEVAEVFLLNVWCVLEPGCEGPEMDTLQKAPCSAVLACLRLLARGIAHWHEKAGAEAAASCGGMDVGLERMVERCNSALLGILQAPAIYMRAPLFAEKHRGAWEAWRAEMRKLLSEAGGSPRLQALRAELRTLSDPLQVCAASVPSEIREYLGGDMTSDDVTRRTLMWAMWATMDRSNHDAVDVDALALMMHDVAALQCSRVSLLVYNMWLSSLFILHNNKHGTPERVIGRHYLLSKLPRLIRSMQRLEQHAALPSSSPFTGFVVDSELISADGAVEQAFARVRQWPQFLHIDVQPSAQPPGRPVQPDVWEMVCTAFVRAGAMSEAQVRAHIKPLVGWTLPPLVDAGKEALVAGAPPVTAADVCTLYAALMAALAQPAALDAAPAEWAALLAHAERAAPASRDATHAILTVPPPPACARAPAAARRCAQRRWPRGDDDGFVTWGRGAGAGAARRGVGRERWERRGAARGVRAAGAGAERAPRGGGHHKGAPPLPYCCPYPCPYCTLPLLTRAKPAVVDIIKAEGWLRRLLFGLVSRVDAVGDEVPAGEHAAKLHALFADLFLTAVSPHPTHPAY